jgi:hypothetical protein
MQRQKIRFNQRVQIPGNKKKYRFLSSESPHRFSGIYWNEEFFPEDLLVFDLPESALFDRDGNHHLMYKGEPEFPSIFLVTGSFHDKKAIIYREHFSRARKNLPVICPCMSVRSFPDFFLYFGILF